MGQLANVIGQVCSGKLDAGEAADRIRKMKLASRPIVPKVTDVLGGSDDPYGGLVEDDGHELGDAFHDGKITMDQYKVLYPAIAAAERKPSAGAAAAK